MKYIILLLIFTTDVLSVQDISALPPSFSSRESCEVFDKYITYKFSECEEEIKYLKSISHYSIDDFEYDDFPNTFEKVEKSIIYLQGKRDAYSEFLYKLD